VPVAPTDAVSLIALRQRAVRQRIHAGRLMNGGDPDGPYPRYPARRASRGGRNARRHPAPHPGLARRPSGAECHPTFTGFVPPPTLAATSTSTGPSADALRVTDSTQTPMAAVRKRMKALFMAGRSVARTAGNRRTRTP
jgi:hypothetical protein